MAVTFETPVLFLEFFVREVSYFGSNQSAAFPPGTLFYAGPSLAVEKPLNRVRKWPDSRMRPGSLGFVDGQPVLSAEHKAVWETILADGPLDAVWCDGYEYWQDRKWVREINLVNHARFIPGFSRFAGVADLAPVRFNIRLEEEQGIITTDFPGSETFQTLEVGQTYLFLCRQDQYEYKYCRATPNRNMCLFVKNHGFHTEIPVVPAQKIADYDPAHLCGETVKIRDHRKSRFKYILG